MVEKLILKLSLLGQAATPQRNKRELMVPKSRGCHDTEGRGCHDTAGREGAVTQRDERDHGVGEREPRVGKGPK